MELLVSLRGDRRVDARDIARDRADRGYGSVFSCSLLRSCDLFDACDLRSVIFVEREGSSDARRFAYFEGRRLVNRVRSDDFVRGSG